MIVREDRNIFGGGLIIAVLRNYTATPVEIKYEKEENPELFWIKLHTTRNHKPIFLSGLYRSQRDIRSKNMINCLEESIHKLTGRKGQQSIVIVGDANLHIDWDPNQPKENSSTKPLDEQMLKLCDNSHLIQLVNFPTRIEETLDILLTSEPSSIVSVQPAPPLADHDLVIADFEAI